MNDKLETSNSSASKPITSYDLFKIKHLAKHYPKSLVLRAWEDVSWMVSSSNPADIAYVTNPTLLQLLNHLRGIQATVSQTPADHVTPFQAFDFYLRVIFLIGSIGQPINI